MSEYRCDPITGKWVIIAADRAKKPDQFKKEKEVKQPPAVVASCPFCSGNEDKTPPEIFVYPASRKPKDGPGWLVRVVPNKFNALGIDERNIKTQPLGLYYSMTGYGAHEVIIESPQHDIFFEDQPLEQMKTILHVFKERMVDLYLDNKIKQVVIFKNSGQEAGASIAHPHSQLIATAITPIYQKGELQGAREYFKNKRSCIWCDMLIQELRMNIQIFDTAGNVVKEDPPKIRLVFENENFAAFCPYASHSPYEIHILPKRHSHFFGNIGKHNSLEIDDLVQMFKIVLQKLNGALKDIYPGRVPYSFGLHTSPNMNARHFETIEEDFHWHFEIYPVVSMLAGFEKTSGLDINKMPPEVAAKNLRETIVEENKDFCSK